MVTEYCGSIMQWNEKARVFIAIGRVYMYINTYMYMYVYTHASIKKTLS